MGYRETRRHGGFENNRPRRRRSQDYDRTPPGIRPAHVVVKPKGDEHIDRTIKRFLKKVKKLKVVEIHRMQTEFFEKPSVHRNRKKRRKKALLKKLKETPGDF